MVLWDKLPQPFTLHLSLSEHLEAMCPGFKHELNRLNFLLIAVFVNETKSEIYDIDR